MQDGLCYSFCRVLVIFGELQAMAKKRPCCRPVGLGGVEGLELVEDPGVRDIDKARRR